LEVSLLDQEFYIAIDYRKFLMVLSEVPVDLYVPCPKLQGQYNLLVERGDSISKLSTRWKSIKSEFCYIAGGDSEEILNNLVNSEELGSVRKFDLFKHIIHGHLRRIFYQDRSLSIGAFSALGAVGDLLVDHMLGFSPSKLQKVTARVEPIDKGRLDHLFNTALLSYLIFELYTKGEGVTVEDRKDLLFAVLLHDLGFITIPEAIEHKQGDLTEEEFNEIKRHPAYGDEILQEMMPQIKSEQETRRFMLLHRVIMEHHENVDGTGYPAGKKGEELHLWAKVLSIADFFDAMTTYRTYQDKYSSDRAIEIMQDCVGSKLDEKIFSVFSHEIMSAILNQRKMNHGSFFSISHSFIPIGKALTFDLYINSSNKVGHEHFIKIVTKETKLDKEDVDRYVNKFFQIYIMEADRDIYLKSILHNNDDSEEVVIEQTEAMQGLAISYLENIFEYDGPPTTEVLNEAIDGAKDVVDGMVDILQDHNINQMQDLIGNLSFHDFYTYDHSVHVAMYTTLIYRTIRPNASKESVLSAGLGALFHDIGKTMIPTEIINNPGKLSEEEYDVIKTHPAHGRDLTNDCVIEGVELELVQRIIYEHHENVDGKGYPEQKGSDDIHFLAKIVAIADFFDAITTKRSYADNLTAEDALRLMSKYRGTKIDTVIFDQFVKNIKGMLKRSKRDLDLVGDFDPCQPVTKLPIRESFGKVIGPDGKESTYFDDGEIDGKKGS
jgi:HD-GYP domain-containing protein (c-di-GMP phosphodiesterase class II)